MSEPFAPADARAVDVRREHLLEGELREVGQGRGPASTGTGAYVLESWQKGAQLALTKNPHYWQPGKAEGRPDRDPGRRRRQQPRVLLLQSGQVDIIDFVPPNQVQPPDERRPEDPEGGGDGDPALHAQRDASSPWTRRTSAARWPTRSTAAAVAKNIWFGRPSWRGPCCRAARSIMTRNADPVTFDIAEGEGPPREELRAQWVHRGRQYRRREPRLPATRRRSGPPGSSRSGITLKIELLEQTTLIQMRNAEKYSDLQRRVDERHPGSRRAPGRRAGLRPSTPPTPSTTIPRPRSSSSSSAASSIRRSARRS